MSTGRLPPTLPPFQPILPILQGVPVDDPAWLLEPKYDGSRGMLYLMPRGLLPPQTWHRDHPFPRAAEQARTSSRPSVILYGRIASLDEERGIFRPLLDSREPLHIRRF
jgi:hypothetical protein